MTRILVVGSLVMDLAFDVPAVPGPGEVILATAFGRYRGGKGYNQAVAAARMGAEVVMVGAVGDDDFGRAFLTALDAEGVDASRVVVLDGVATAVAVPLVTPDGDVGFVQYQGANRQLDAAVAADLPDCDALLLQGEIQAPVSLAAARAVRSRGGRVVLNPAPVHDISDELATTATVITPNEVEAAALLGRDAADLDGEAAARALVTDQRAAVVTLGARGAAWADGSRSGAVAPPGVEAIDATAAGDSFNAALAIALAEGQGYADALRFATAAGAHATTIRGAEPALPTRADVEALLDAAGSD
ncbi:ribokinase [Euzebya sp.]|uniref:ribokinase n=1 Tax=Euzebya sp. TaxID=1971409 RepID=UPI0035197896